MNRPNLLRFIVIRDDEERYTAVCIEHYIAAQGDSAETAMDRLKIAYRADLDYSLTVAGKPFEGIEPAPAKYREMLISREGYEETGVIYDGAPAELQIAA
ncbi:MAG: hypothetical protein OXC63_02055 [Aestuariivita sp.]|nr:hypothetical protein [Aestuariivita sp.]